MTKESLRRVLFLVEVSSMILGSVFFGIESLPLIMHGQKFTETLSGYFLLCIAGFLFLGSALVMEEEQRRRNKQS